LQIACPGSCLCAACRQIYRIGLIELASDYPGANALLALEMIEAETIRQGEVAGWHSLVDRDGDGCTRSLRRQPRLSSIRADPCRVAKAPGSSRGGRLGRKNGRVQVISPVA